LTSAFFITNDISYFDHLCKAIDVAEKQYHFSEEQIIGILKQG